MQQRNLLLVAALLIGTPIGAGFGYVQSGAQAATTPGDEVHVDLYLSGINETVKVTRTDAPASWDVNVSSGQVTFPVDDGFRYMATGGGYRQVVPLTVTAAVPADAAPGDHDITVVLVGEQAADTADHVAVRQRQDISFTVTVAGATGNQPATPEEQAETEDTMQGNLPAEDTSEGMTIVADDTMDTGDNAATSSPTGAVGDMRWGRPVVLLLLFEITWGIVIIYALKRRK